MRTEPGPSDPASGPSGARRAAGAPRPPPRGRATRRLLAAAAALTFAGLGAPSRTEAEPPVVLDRLVDDTMVFTSVRVQPGTYRVRDAGGDGVLRVLRDGVTVDLTGVTLIGSADGGTPDGFEGVGVAVVGAKAVTVRGGRIRGYRVNVRAEACRGLALETVDAGGSRAMRLRSTPAREDPADWLWPQENDAGQWEARYGAGFSLTDCPGARVEDCRASHAQNGLLLSRCDGARVVSSDFSWNSGWGIALWRTNRPLVAWNRCDGCVRGYSHGVYARGQDSAGILVFEQCSDGVFWRNSATRCGDGFFLYAGHETTRRTGTGGSNRNLVAENDFSFAVANGIEATFSVGNEFLGNDLEDCDHGIWAGYGRETRIEGNRIVGCRNGVSIEHGRENAVRFNDLRDCRTGVHLWWDPDPDLLASAFGKANDVTSGANRVEANRFAFGGAAVRLVDDHDSIVRANEFHEVGTVLEARGDVRNLFFRHNRVAGEYRVRGDTRAPLRIGRDARTTPVLGAPPAWTIDRPEAEPAPAPWLAPLGPKGRVERAAARIAPSPRGDGVPVRLASAPRPGRVAGLEGREWILVDEWGPVDPRACGVFPAVAAGSPRATFRVLGPDADFEVLGTSPGVVALPRSGRAPCAVEVRPAAEAGGPSLTPFALRVRVGGVEFPVRGTLLATTWDVAWWPWTTDPRTDPAAWARLLQGAPAARRSLPSLDVAGGGSPAEGVPADRFATVATTTLRVPAGRYRFRVTSDDGVRLLVDGRRVFEDWTWHGPKEDVVETDLSEGPHDLRVEHFELDGWAALRVSVEPAEAAGQAPRPPEGGSNPR